MPIVQSGLAAVECLGCKAEGKLSWVACLPIDIYLRQISSAFNYCLQQIAVLASVILGIFALTVAAAGQAMPAGLSKDCSSYKSIPLPVEAASAPVPKSFPNCASYRSYRGIGRPVNYAAARSCAWQERAAQQAELSQSPKEPIAWVVGGSLILADIYFNGDGVNRNIPLAMRFACEFDESAAKFALPKIEKLNGPMNSQAPFELCEYAGTTFTLNFCQSYQSKINEDHRSRFYDQFMLAMPPEQKASFGKLLAAKKTYIQAHSSEVDQGGTIRAIRTIGSMDILEDLFHTDVVHFERKQWPAISVTQIAAADVLLESEYKKKALQLRMHTKEEVDMGAVTESGLGRVEKAWKSYRDAWTAFARLRYPSAAESIRAKVTLDRRRLLKTIE
jgi:hypothetical protein